MRTIFFDFKAFIRVRLLIRQHNGINGYLRLNSAAVKAKIDLFYVNTKYRHWQRTRLVWLWVLAHLKYLTVWNTSLRYCTHGFTESRPRGLNQSWWSATPHLIRDVLWRWIISITLFPFELEKLIHSCLESVLFFISYPWFTTMIRSKKITVSWPEILNTSV